MVKIKIDYKKCRFSQGCRRCLEICPMFVFISYSNERRTKLKAPNNYFIKPVFDSLCIKCFKCVEECEAGAISIGK